jgi:hypothetical protein
MTDLYIYYRVQDGDVAPLQAQVRAMQERLAQSHGVAGQLKRRPGSVDGLQTWMEVYPATPGGFDAALALAVQQGGLQALTVGARHTELFTDVVTDTDKGIAPCA